MTLPRGSELLIILLIVLLLFGARRLPDLAESLGKSLKVFRRSTSDDEGDGSASDGTDERA